MHKNTSLLMMNFQSSFRVSNQNDNCFAISSKVVTLILSRAVRKQEDIESKAIREGKIKGIVIISKMMLYMKKF